MAEPIPFVKLADPVHGRVDQLSPLVRRVIAANPGPFTYTGTGTYVIGRGQVAVIDPGPLDDAHLSALFAAVEGETVSHILITHTHMDHSPAAAPLKAITGARTYGYGPHERASDGTALVEEGGDMAFVPDVVVRDGDRITGESWAFEAVHTPGHTANHLCFALSKELALFTGDHVMGWSTTVISPPDGDMQAYLDSLEKLLNRDDAIYYPTHGAPVVDPKPLIRALIAHRHEREEQIISALGDSALDLMSLVPIVYAAVDKRLHPAAARSMLAHMIRLQQTGRIVCEDGRYRTS